MGRITIPSPKINIIFLNGKDKQNEKASFVVNFFEINNKSALEIITSIPANHKSLPSLQDQNYGKVRKSHEVDHTFIPKVDRWALKV